MKVEEKCSCGATFQAKGLFARTLSNDWRITHPCPNRKSRDAQWIIKKYPEEVE